MFLTWTAAGVAAVDDGAGAVVRVDMGRSRRCLVLGALCFVELWHFFRYSITTEHEAHRTPRSGITTSAV